MSRPTTGVYGDFPDYYCKDGNLFGSYLKGKSPKKSWDGRHEHSVDGGHAVIFGERTPSAVPDATLKAERALNRLLKTEREREKALLEKGRAEAKSGRRALARRRRREQEIKPQGKSPKRQRRQRQRLLETTSVEHACCASATHLFRASRSRLALRSPYFSYFLQVLDSVAGALNGLAMGPLTGSVPPTERQKLVDEFSSRREPAVLVSQIQAGGVGLNIQAASVVLLTEPQWKRTTEDQAIARCHRMGQARPVDVHRLLAENSVDQRMLEILAQKQLLFDEYVRRSDLKESSPEAIDISDLEVTEQVVSQAEAERRIIELEQRRLGFEPVAI